MTVGFRPKPRAHKSFFKANKGLNLEKLGTTHKKIKITSIFCRSTFFYAVFHHIKWNANWWLLNHFKHKNLSRESALNGSFIVHCFIYSFISCRPLLAQIIIHIPLYTLSILCWAISVNNCLWVYRIRTSKALMEVTRPQKFWVNKLLERELRKSSIALARQG